MKKKTVGRRIPVVEGLSPYNAVTQPGDYYGPVVGWTDDKPAVHFLLPIATPTNPKWGEGIGSGLHVVCSPPHVFIEESDGTLSIYESIGAGPQGNYYWHGYLRKGNWEEC